MKTEKITLIDGSELECYPIALRPNIVTKEDIALKLDTTGEYLQIGNKPKHNPTPKEEQEQRQKDQETFYKHIHLFLANADKILSDSRLFLAPVNINNGLAYTGGSGLRGATLGVYIEWWLYHKEASIDGKGNPIWYISGSPLSGCHACSTADRKGKTHKAHLNGRFSAVWSSFMNVNRRYAEARGQYMAYSLYEVVELLQGETDKEQLFKIHLRLEKVKYDNFIANLKNALIAARKTAFEYNAKIQRLLVESHREQVEAYYNKCLNLETCSKLAHQEFLDRRIELRKQLRSGAITNIEYQHTLSPIRKRDLNYAHQLSQYRYEGLCEILGEDAHYLTYSAVEDILTAKPEEKDENN